MTAIRNAEVFPSSSSNVVNGINVTDLFALIDGHPEYHAADGIHFNDRGVAAQAEQVSARIMAVLDAPR